MTIRYSRKITERQKQQARLRANWHCELCRVDIWELHISLFPMRPALDWSEQRRLDPKQHEFEYEAIDRMIADLREYERRLRDRSRVLQHVPWAAGKKPGDALYHIDHKVPLTEGGDNSDDNLRFLCLFCHHKETAILRARLAKRPVKKRTGKRIDPE